MQASPLSTILVSTRGSRHELDARLHKLELEARSAFGEDIESRYVRTSDGFIKVEFRRKEPVVLTSEPLHTDTLQGLGQFHRNVTKVVDDINTERRLRMSNVTGASLLGSQFRSNLAAVKDKINKAGQKMTDALKDLDDTAAQASAVADQVTAETADLKAALGLHTNGGPTV